MYAQITMPEFLTTENGFRATEDAQDTGVLKWKDKKNGCTLRHIADQGNINQRVIAPSLLVYQSYFPYCN